MGVSELSRSDPLSPGKRRFQQIIRATWSDYRPLPVAARLLNVECSLYTTCATLVFVSKKSSVVTPLKITKLVTYPLGNRAPRPNLGLTQRRLTARKGGELIFATPTVVFLLFYRALRLLKYRVPVLL